LTGCKADHGVGSRLDFLDEVAVEDDLGAIETGDVNHDDLSKSTSAASPRI
jgi:hypothetical protein